MRFSPAGAILSCGQQLSAVMAGNSAFDDCARLMRGAEPHLGELLGAAERGGFSEHASSLADFALKVMLKRDRAAFAQAPGALLHDRLRNLRHARRGRAGARRKRKDMQISQSAFTDEIE